MERPNQVTVEKTFLTSRRVTQLFWICFLTAGLIGIPNQVFNRTWLASIVPWLVGISIVLIVFSWIMPGIFILLRHPWLARAWLRGITPSISNTPWEELSKGDVFFTYF